jgi:hypothetical protein
MTDGKGDSLGNKSLFFVAILVKYSAPEAMTVPILDKQIIIQFTSRCHRIFIQVSDTFFREHLFINE